jgi:hypothetical protein
MGSGCLGFSVLKLLILPAKVENVGISCFLWCHSLSRFEFAGTSRSREVGKRAFSQCQLLESVVLPAGFRTAEIASENSITTIIFSDQ